MKAVLQRWLWALGGRILAKYKPIVVGITGSVGKTSTKEAVAAVLSAKFSVRQNIKSYNNEFGLPLTIIGAVSGGRSPVRWAGVLLRALGLLLLRLPYPKVLVLEMGADRPGNVRASATLARPHVAVLTALGHTHTEHFGSFENVVKEKSVLVKSAPKNGLVVLNADDENVRGVRAVAAAPVVTFGFSDGADVRGAEATLSDGGEKGGVKGMSVKVIADGTVTPVYLPGVVGGHLVLTALAAIAVGRHFGMNMVEMAAALRAFRPPPGRMNLLPGLKGAMLLDDTYNSSPMAAIAALDTLHGLPGFARRIAVLGDMAELGALSDADHAAVGGKVAMLRLDELVTIGAKGKKIAAAAQDNGMDEGRIFSFDAAPEAGRFLQNRVHAGDLVLVKGSQSMRMEKIVKEIMAEPERAAELLVRQEPSWQKK